MKGRGTMGKEGKRIEWRRFAGRCAATLLSAVLICSGPAGLTGRTRAYAQSSGGKTEACAQTTAKKNKCKTILNQSKGYGITKKQKKVLDILMKKWIKGKYTDEYTKERMDQLMEKWGYTREEGGASLFSNKRFQVDPSQKLPDYAKKFSDAQDVKYLYYWIYTYGEKDEMGYQYMYEWGSVYFD